MLRGPLGFRLEFDRLRDVVALLAVAAVGTFLVAVTFVSIIRLGNAIPEPDFHHTVMRSWMRPPAGDPDQHAALLVDVVGLVQYQTDSAPIARASEIVAQFCTVIFVLWFIFGSGWADPVHKLNFICLFLPLIWVAMRRTRLSVAAFGLAVMQLGFMRVYPPTRTSMRRHVGHRTAVHAAGTGGHRPAVGHGGLREPRRPQCIE